MLKKVSIAIGLLALLALVAGFYFFKKQNASIPLDQQIKNISKEASQGEADPGIIDKVTKGLDFSKQ